MVSQIAFACPVHKSALDGAMRCDACNRTYPVVRGIPILLNEANSLFSIADYTQGDHAYGGASDYAGSLDSRRGLRQVYRRLMSRLVESSPVAHEFEAEDAVRHIVAQRPEAKILVIGAGERSYDADAVYTDVALGKHVSCIADAHDLPFLDASFDACLACAVLEHVVDPHRCVAEIERVLKPGGFVFAETPFMQPVHMGAHDFTRFTYLGHRRLFRRFDEVKSGMAGGPATSAAQIVRSALIALTDRPNVKKVLKLMGLLVTYPLRWLDRLTMKQSSAYDSASGFYFFGRLRSDVLSDREIIKCYRGG